MKILQVPERTCNVVAFTPAVTSAVDVSWAVAAVHPRSGTEQLANFPTAF